MKPKAILRVLLELVAILWVEHSFAQIVLSEIQFNPSGNERYDEFIEIYNASETDTVDLRGWLISDGTGFNLIFPYQQGSKLAPLSFAVIFVPGYYQQSGYYDAIMPEAVLRLTIDKSAFGSYGLNNSRSETVSIFSPDSQIVSSYTYTVPNNDGISEEKIILTAGDQQQNWRHSLVVNGTPGRRNSVSPPDYDLALEEENCRFLSRSNNPADSVTYCITLFNRGLRPARNFHLSIVWDANNGGKPQSAETLKVIVSSQRIAPQDSLIYCGVLSPLPAGMNTFWIFLDFPEDENPENNSIEISMQLALPPPLLLITECLPLPQIGFSWWVELYNADSISVDLHGLRLRYSGDEDDILLGSSAGTLEPGHYLVISPSLQISPAPWPLPCPIIMVDNRWPESLIAPFSLSLMSNEGLIIDSFTWQQDNSAGVSIERKGESQQWDYCCHPNKATPGARNSITAPFADAAIPLSSIRFSPNPPQWGMPIGFTIGIQNYGNLDACLRQLTCYQINPNLPSDTLGTHFLPLEECVAGGDSTLCTLEVVPCMAGITCFSFELSAIADVYQMNNIAKLTLAIPYRKNALVINELYYNTEEKQEEWIELFNPSSATIDLQGFVIKDAHKSVRITAQSLRLAGGEYLVLSNRLFSDPNNPSLIPFVVSSLPELNNNGDQVVLLAADGICIDSVAYSASWGGGRFISLERVRWEDDSNDSANWHSCRDPSGATPGRVNSCSPKARDAAIVPNSFQCKPSTPKQGETVELSCMIENVGREVIAELTVEFYSIDVRGAIEELGGDHCYELLPRQRQMAKIIWRDVPPGTFAVSCSLRVPGDEDDTNDGIVQQVMIGYEPSPIIINEIMYAPIANQPEWIECYNRSDYAVDVRQWRLSDADSLIKKILSKTMLICEPQTYWIIAADTFKVENDGGKYIFTILKDWPTLNNDADDVFLYDGVGRLIDHIQYTSAWGGAIGRSLERLSTKQPSLDKSNWSTCTAANGHTAGSRNSVFFEVLPASTTLEVAPVPFSPDGDGRDDHLAISYRLPAKTAYINLRIFDCNGHLVRFLCNYEPSGAEATVFWDGKDGGGQFCRMGLYIIHLQAFDELNGKVMQAKKVCVLARAL